MDGNNVNKNCTNKNVTDMSQNEPAVGGAGFGVETENSHGMPMQSPYVVPSASSKPDTEYTKRMKENFSFFGPVTLLYAIFYAFCMYHNGSGVTFPFFVAGSLLYLCFSLSKLEISLKKDAIFYMVSMMLLAVSTFCTDDWKIIAFNKTGIFLLMMSLLLHQFYDTSKWKLGKYCLSILELVVCSIGELGRPFSDCARYYKGKDKKDRTTVYILLGIVISVPLLLMVVSLLSSADVVFRQITDKFFRNFQFTNIMNVVVRVVFLFSASYLLLAYLSRKAIREEVLERKNGEPILAITITSLLSAVYLLFSGIQIIYLFLGQMQLPEGYTYAEYAREGFFQLLAVSALNLIIVLVVMSFFKENKVLKVILTIMSLCTFVMIASSALRMIIYIRYYYLTFLRILVLWGLALLFLLFVGVIVSIYREKFPLFQYSMVVVTVLYTVLSFSHPDYIIAKVNVANAPRESMETWNPSENNFFQSSGPYHDYYYLSMLSADAAPVLIPYMEELGYDLSMYCDEDVMFDGYDRNGEYIERYEMNGFGFYYMKNIHDACRNFSLRTYNISRHMALRLVEEYMEK